MNIIVYSWLPFLVFCLDHWGRLVLYTHIRQVDGPNTAEVALVKYIGHGMFTIFAGFVYIKKKPPSGKVRNLPLSRIHHLVIWEEAGCFTNWNQMESMGFLRPVFLPFLRVRSGEFIVCSDILLYSGICKIIHDGLGGLILATWTILKSTRPEAFKTNGLNLGKL